MPVQVRLRAHAGPLPPVKARRRQNAIDNLNAVSKAASRSGARRDGRSQRDFETHNIKAETANPHAGINAADEKSVAELLPATGETGTV